MGVDAASWAGCHMLWFIFAWTPIIVDCWSKGLGCHVLWSIFAWTPVDCWSKVLGWLFWTAVETELAKEAKNPDEFPPQSFTITKMRMMTTTRLSNPPVIPPVLMESKISYSSFEFKTTLCGRMGCLPDGLYSAMSCILEGWVWLS